MAVSIILNKMLCRFEYQRIFNKK